MSKELNRIIEESRKGYIDRAEEIAVVMNTLGGMSVSELVTMVGADCRKRIENLAPGILKDEYDLYLNLSEAERLKLTDLMCLVEYTKLDGYGKDEPTDGMEYTDEELVYIQPYRYVGIYYLDQLFQEARKTNYTFKAYCSFQAEAFYHYLEAVSHDPSLWEIFRARAASVQIDLTDSTTVGMILNQASGIQRIPWSPWRSMEAYRRKTLTAYRISAELLLRTFRHAFPTAFKMETVLKKCRRMHVPE